MATPLEQLDLMRNLRENWDGYGAEPVVPEVVEVAKEFVDLLAAVRDRTDRYEGIHVSPGRAGGVLIEWDEPGYEHELEVNPDGSLGFLHTDLATGQMIERRFPPGRHAVQPGVLKEIRDLVTS